MKAIYTPYGLSDGVRLAHMPEPSSGAGNVLAKTHAAAVNNADVLLLAGKPFLVRMMG